MGITTITSCAIAALAAALGAMTLLRDKKSPANISYALGMSLLGIEGIFAGFSLSSSSLPEMLQWQKFRLISMSLIPGIWLLFSLCYSRGNYAEFLARWRLALAAGFLVPLAAVGLGWNELIQVSAWSQEHKEIRLGNAGIFLQTILLLASVVILTNLERTLSAAVGTMRWRIKFMILGIGVLFVIRIYSSSQALLYSTLNLELGRINGIALVASCLLMGLSLLRSGTLNIDIYPSHAVIYKSLTLVLTGVYLLAVGIFAHIAGRIGGDLSSLPVKSFSMLIGLIALAAFLLSDRASQQLKRFVSRHFKRPTYDYRQIWATFTAKTASVMNDLEFCRTTAYWISETFQLLSVTVWLTDENEGRLAFAASTSLPEADAVKLEASGSGLQDLIKVFQNKALPIDIDASNETWVSEIKRQNPDFFPNKGGNRVAVPLVVREQFLGLIIVGDRVSGLPFTTEDMDLLKSVGDQVAASLLNLQQSKQLLQAREMEAFQTMSAFFVHDLKNTASTLSLMLQNLHTHFEDPAFREDAMRAVSKSVNHLNDLIGRLSALRQGMKMSPVLADLNETVRMSLAGLGNMANIRLEQELTPVPKLMMDAGQMQKVIINLVLNARDAVEKDGSIRIETSQQNGWAVLSVADDGCGMSEAFMKKSLFRPFQTTKKKGIGIGMFHSKMIVEAHRGRIEAASRCGEGTTFRVLLPLTA